MKKILVTGASGFIGNYVITELLKRQQKVIATSTSEHKCLSMPWFPHVDYIPFKFEEFATEVNYFDFFEKPDAVIHLAWEGLPNYKSLFHFEKNLPVHYSFLKNLIINGVRDVSVTGTCFEYGFKEGELKEQMPADPVNAYAIAKDALRRFMQQLQASHSFIFKWIRLFYMYGKGQNPNAVFSQLDKAIENNDPVFNMSGGEQVRDFLPVEDVAAFITSIALQEKITGIINCCSGQPKKLKDLVLQYIKEKKSDITVNLGYYPYPDYEPMIFWGNNNKLQTIIKNEKSF
ncbi:MAG: NAD-dependent epimerase/dehydratase family protein [Flavisolibacter sp.]